MRPEEKQKRKETTDNDRQMRGQIEQQDFLSGMRIGQNRALPERPVRVSVNNQSAIRQPVRVTKHNPVEPHSQKQAKQQAGYAQPIHMEPINH